MTLTPQQLADLTGYKRPSDQADWLDRQGIPYRVKRDGTPALTMRMYEEACLRGRTKGPNLKAVL